MTRKVAIVGSGPSGCYTAQALLKLDPGLGVDLIDRLPVPYGLVRYGVAADHQGTKAVTRQFDRLFERMGAGFVGNVCVGRDITLDGLRQVYDAVVLATGLWRDRQPGVPGQDLPGVVGAGALTRHWNDHPEAAETPLLGGRVVILGNGNVAVDVLRLLLKDEAELHGSDLHPRHSAHIAASGLARIDVVGRSPAVAAKFDPVMVRELAKLGAAGFTLRDVGEGEDPRIQALQSLPGPDGTRLQVVFHFGWTPVAFDGTDRITAARFARGTETLELPCDALVTAIGFEDGGLLDRAGLIATAEDAEGGVVEPGLYLAGWFARGPRGTIPDGRAAAQALAARIAADLAESQGPERPGRLALGADFTDYAGWQRIDAAERAAPAPGRVREKITDRDRLLALARATKETDG